MGTPEDTQVLVVLGFGPGGDGGLDHIGLSPVQTSQPVCGAAHGSYVALTLTTAPGRAPPTPFWTAWPSGA